MKNFVLLLSFLFIIGSISIKGDNFDRLNLSETQKIQIKKLRKEASYKFQEIGRSNIIGQEKGRQKREVAMELKESIRKVLDSNQQAKFENLYGDFDSNTSLRDIAKDEYEDRLDRLENEFDLKIDQLENDRTLSKNEQKYRAKELKKEYKSNKEKIKLERDKALSDL